MLIAIVRMKDSFCSHGLLNNSLSVWRTKKLKGEHLGTPYWHRKIPGHSHSGQHHSRTPWKEDKIATVSPGSTLCTFADFACVLPVCYIASLNAASPPCRPINWCCSYNSCYTEFWILPEQILPTSSWEEEKKPTTFLGYNLKKRLFLKLFWFCL